jgi:Kef-type K+ transport system membrane component KefB
MPSRGAPPSLKLTLIGYGVMLAAALGLFDVIRRFGQHLVARGDARSEPSAAPAAPSETFLHVLLALNVIILVARTLGALFKRLQQPPVIGEVIAGIALGPSLLGRFAPEAARFVLPPAVAPFLSVIAQVGVVIFMFLVGLDLDTRRLRERTHATVAISHASIVVPFLLGSALALWLYPSFSTAAVPFTIFALFLGVSLSVTAFPVLARILTDRKLHKSQLGVIALTCAAVDDVSAWCLLALLVGLAKAQTAGVLGIVAGSLLYVAVMLVVVRPGVARWVRRQELRRELPQGAIAAVFVGVLASALVTEAIGIHAIFGAFLLGVILPHDSLLARELTRRLEDVVVILLLPAFFAFTGMRTQVGLLSQASHWLVALVIIAVASLGKFGGTFVAGRLTGLTSRDAASVGILMNTRGLMELVVLNIGLDLGVISPTLFAMLVMMAVVTTLATTPILQLLQRSSGSAAAAEGTERTRPSA